jgi:hypothetical protein
VHLRDHRLRQPRDGHHHPAAARKERLDVVDVAHRPDLLEIVARTEPPPACREHDHTDARVRPNPIERGLQLVDERT